MTPRSAFKVNGVCGSSDKDDDNEDQDNDDNGNDNDDHDIHDDYYYFYKLSSKSQRLPALFPHFLSYNIFT